MATTTHPVALFEEGFMLVGVQSADVETLGEQAVYDLVQNHPWVAAKNIPVVLVFENADGEMEAFGDRQLVDAITEMDFEEIAWGHELTLDWPDEPSAGEAADEGGNAQNILSVEEDDAALVAEEDEDEDGEDVEAIIVVEEVEADGDEDDEEDDAEDE
jgi:hypothetical protein